MPQVRLTFLQWLYAKAMALKGMLRLILWAVVIGPFTRRLGSRFSDPDRLRRGLVLVLPGIEGESLLNRGIAHGLDEAGVSYAIEIFDWTRGRILFMDNLMDLPRNRCQAVRLAQRIRQYQQDHPGKPVHLVGHSAGTGLAAMALEQLDDHDSITSAVFLASALSPGYDLVPALRRSRHGIHHFHSRYDGFYLIWGTSTFGTIDRRRCRAAGADGFQIPKGLSPADADIWQTGLRQVPWQWSMIKVGHPGGHLGWAGRRFVRDYLSGIILNGESGDSAR